MLNELDLPVRSAASAHVASTYSLLENNPLEYSVPLQRSQFDEWYSAVRKLNFWLQWMYLSCEAYFRKRAIYTEHVSSILFYLTHDKRSIRA